MFLELDPRNTKLVRSPGSLNPSLCFEHTPRVMKGTRHLPSSLASKQTVNYTEVQGSHRMHGLAFSHTSQMKYLQTELRNKEQNHQDHESLYFSTSGRGTADRQVSQNLPHSL